MTLPKGWAVAPLGVVAEIRLGKMLDKARTTGTHRPYLRNINVRWDSIDTTDLLTMPFKDEELERYGIQTGDLLVCEGGEPGRSAIWTQGSTNLKYQKALHRVRLAQGMSGRWVMFSLMRDASTGQLSRRFTGSTIAHLPREKLLEYELTIPPAAEQGRIIETLDAHFSRLDAAVANLEAAQRKLKAYRASVLKDAVEGRLVPTEAELARKEGRSYEPADVLLERILRERRRRWEEAELARMRTAGKTPKDDRWKAKYSEPERPDVDNLPTLPEGWCWATLDGVADVKGGITKGQRRRPREELREVPYLRVANVQRGYLDLSQIKTIEATPSEVDDLRLQPGDVLFNEGGDRDKLGRGWVWNGEIPDCIHQNHVFRARIVVPLRPRFVSWYANSSGQAYFFAQGTQTTNLASVNMTKLKALPVPIPPLAEQDRVLDEVERLLSVADATARYLGDEAQRCRSLRQAMLRWAFEGRLVDQDPDDEPADALLARIRAERAEAAPAKPKPKPARRLKAAS